MTPMGLVEPGEMNAESDDSCSERQRSTGTRAQSVEGGGADIARFRESLAVALVNYPFAPAHFDNRSLLVHVVDQRLAEIELHDLHVIRVGEYGRGDSGEVTPVGIVMARLEKSVDDGFGRLSMSMVRDNVKHSMSRVKNKAP